MSELPQEWIQKSSSESTASGPLDSNVVESTMATITPRSKRRGRSGRLWIVGGLVILVCLGFFFESKEQLETEGSPLGQIAEKPLQESSQMNIDVDAPPIPQHSHSLDHPSRQRPQTLWEPSDDKPNKFSLFSWGQSTRIEKETSIQSFKKKKKAKKRAAKAAAKQALHPIPIIDENDDRVPQAAEGAVYRAADALLCRESVIDYVINATDLKDECDGLKKAYTKNCGGDEGEEPVTEQPRRRLVQIKRSAKNPLIAWQQWLHRKSHYIRRHWLWTSKPAAFLIEDEVLEEWDDASYEVLQGWDLDNDGEFLLQDVMTTLGTSSLPRRRISTEADDFIRAEDRIDKKETKAQMATEATASEIDSPPLPLTQSSNNITIPVNKEKPKLTNLALPTNKHHVSEKMLSETLLLQQDDRLMAHVKAATSNATANAGEEAAQSSKAVSDTVDFVASVLNDPISVEARTCCTSILNVFHENCSVDEEEELSDRRLFIVVAVIAFCGLVKSLIRHFQIRWLPEAAGCILVGVASGWTLSFFPHHDLSFDGPWFLRIMVPPIVFEAALSIDKRSFNRHVVPILFYAIIGTLVSTGFTAFFVHEGSKFFQGYCETIPFIESLTFGSLISSIDPIAVLSVLSNMGMTDTDTIYVVIFGESLLNDGVAIVLFQTLVHFLDVNMHVDSDAVAAAAIHFLVVAVGSLLVGLGSGICCTVFYWAMHGCQTPLVEVLMFCCWALLPYYVCDGIEWSGIVAVVAAGFVMDIQVVGQHGIPEDMLEPYSEQLSSSPSTSRRDRRGRAIFLPEGHLSKEAKTHIGFVTEIISTMMETAIFAYLGLFLFSSRYHWNNYHTMIAILACCASRAIMIPALSTLANGITRIQQFNANCRYQQLPQQDTSFSSRQNNPAGVIIDRKMQLVLWFAGLRGAMSFALVESIPTYDTVTGEGTRFKSELKAMTSACIMFTVFVLGGLTYYMMDSLGMAPSHNKEPGSKSNIEKEMEMIGLLSSSRKAGNDFNHANDDEYDKKFNTTEISSNRNAGQPSGSTFRQRTQAN